MTRERAGLHVFVPLAQAGAVLFLAQLPAVRAALPVMGLFDGPLGSVLLALAAGVAVARWRPIAWRPVVPPLLLFAATAGLLASWGVRYAGRLQASGDEVEYLLMAQSLWREHDLDLEDNIARQDYLEYVPGLGSLRPGAYRRDGRPIPVHMPGLPLLLAPVYALGGRSACVVLMGLMAAALAVQVRTLALRSTGDPAAALFAGAVAVGPPVASYVLHLYTELPSALAIALGLNILLGAPGAPAAAAAAFVVSILPWLHVKMVGVAAALGLVALLRLRGRPLFTFLAVAGVMAGAYCLYHWIIFGMPTPLALYGSRVPRKVRTADPVDAALGLFFDGSFGLLPHAPVFLLALAGVPMLLRKRENRHHALVALTALAPALAWRTWWGGFCPPARFLVPLVPLFATAAATRTAEAPRGLARWRWTLLALGLGLAIFMSARPEDSLLLNEKNHPTKTWEALSGSASLGRYLPHLAARNTADRRLALLWLCALGLLLFLDRRARTSDRVDRPFRGLGLPLVLLLAVGTMVDRCGWYSVPSAIEQRGPEDVSEPFSP